MSFNVNGKVNINISRNRTVENGVLLTNKVATISPFRDITGEAFQKIEDIL